MKKGVENNRSKAIKLDVKVENQQKKVGKIVKTEEKQEKYISADQVVKQARLKHRHKLFVMWSGVTFFMLLILGLWFLNIENIFSPSIKRTELDDSFGFEEMKNLTKNIGEQASELQRIFEEASGTSTEKIASEGAESNTIDPENFQPLPDLGSSSPEEVSVKGISSAQVETLKQKLLELAGKNE